MRQALSPPLRRHLRSRNSWRLDRSTGHHLLTIAVPPALATMACDAEALRWKWSRAHAGSVAGKIGASRTKPFFD